MRSKSEKKGKTQKESVEYIAKKLQYYQGKKYKTKKAAKAEAKNIFGKLAEKGEKPTLKNIWQYSRKKREKKKQEVPIIDDFLRQPNPYFSLLEYDYYIKRCPNNVFFKSKLSPSTLPLIQGGDTIDSEEYFLDFVRYCNILKAQTDPNESRYITEWQVMCTEPELEDGVWISDIQCVDEEGNETNYGFDPDKPSAEPKEPMPPKAPTPEPTPTPVPETPTPTPKEPSGDSERAKEIRLIIEGYNQLLRDKIINKKEWRELVDAAIARLSKGGNI